MEFIAIFASLLSFRNGFAGSPYREETEKERYDKRFPLTLRKKMPSLREELRPGLQLKVLRRQTCAVQNTIDL